MGRAKLAAAAALAAMALTACSGGDGGGGGKPTSGHPAQPQGGKPSAPLTKLAVPNGFDVSKGWEQTLAWMPEDARTTPVADAPRSEAVAYLDASEDGYVPTLRDVRTGAVRWRGAPWQPPEAIEDPAGKGVEIPDVVVAGQGGREYVVAWAHGKSGGDGFTKGREVVEAVVYPADAHGSAVEPTRKVTLLLSDSGTAPRSDVEVRDGGGAGLLVTWDKGAQGASVDLVSGHVRSLPSTGKTKTGCVDTCMPGSAYAAVTTAGAVIANDSGGFGIDGGWYSRDVRPSGVPATHDFAQNGTVEGGTGGELVARWHPVAKGSDGDPVWAVHDAATGKVRATVSCGTAIPDEDAGARLSPDGRYLVFDTVAFDLATGKGRCFAETPTHHAVRFVSVAADGTAYGTTPDGTPVLVSLPTGSAVPQPHGLQLPLTLYPDRAIFATADPSGPRHLIIYTRTH